MRNSPAGISTIGRSEFGGELGSARASRRSSATGASRSTGDAAAAMPRDESANAAGSEGAGLGDSPRGVAAGASRLPHLPQNVALAGISALQLGHLRMPAVSFAA